MGMNGILANRSRFVAALFVETDGPYFGLDEVDPWDKPRDARLYDGDAPIVAHPPCQRWSFWAERNPNPRAKSKVVGDDGGCFASALANVRRVGGVIEHPAYSRAWKWFGLPRPRREGGWTDADTSGGRSAHVEQGHYGHTARKATWLYAVTTNYPELIWGPSDKTGLVTTMSIRRAPRGKAAIKRPPLRVRERTPEGFRDVLLSIAKGTIGYGEDYKEQARKVEAAKQARMKDSMPIR